MKEDVGINIKVSEDIARIVAKTSFDFWEDKRFRELIHFDKIPQAEQDRIFNELEVTALGLITLHALQQPKLIPLEQSTIRAFLKMMSDLNIEEEFLDTWKLLIRLRFKEYKEDYKFLLSHSKEWEELKNDPAFRLTWARLETLTLGGLTHIRRRKWAKADPLRRYLRRWLIMLELAVGKLVQEAEMKTKFGVC